MIIVARCTPRGNNPLHRQQFPTGMGVTWLALFRAALLPSFLSAGVGPVWRAAAHTVSVGLRREWLAARLLGFRVLRIGILALNRHQPAIPTVSPHPSYRAESSTQFSKSTIQSDPSTFIRSKSFATAPLRRSTQHGSAPFPRKKLPLFKRPRNLPPVRRDPAADLRLRF